MNLMKDGAVCAPESPAVPFGPLLLSLIGMNETSPTNHPTRRTVLKFRSVVQSNVIHLSLNLFGVEVLKNFDRNLNKIPKWPKVVNKRSTKRLDESNKMFHNFIKHYKKRTVR